MTIEENTLKNPTEKNSKFIRQNISFFWLSLLIIVLDQLTKYLVRTHIKFHDIIYVTPKFFWLTNVRNTGAAFSFSFGSPDLNRVIFLIVSSVASVLLIYIILVSRQKIEAVAYSLILGGAIGNLVDRIIFGSVTDFLWCDFPDFIMERWPVFNLADSSIVIAITILIIYSLFFQTRKQ